MADVLDAFLSARSVAVVGASDDASRIGGRPLRYLREAGYAGDVFPVNPSRPQVQGLASVADVRDIAATPELAIVAVGKDLVPEVLRGCAERGVKSAIVFAAGFAEIGDDGRRAQDELRDIGRTSGMRILGPNCNGCISPANGAAFAFTPVLAEGMPAPGTLAIATQSAAVGTYWLRRMRERHLGLHSLVHTGNEADLALPEVLRALVGRAGVRAVLVGLEQWRDPSSMRTVAEAVAHSQASVVVLPLGTTSIGRAAAASHTGSLVAKANNVAAGLLRDAGALVAEDVDEALVLGATLSAAPAVARGLRAAVLTPSGGFGVLLADALGRAGFELPEMPTELQNRWRERIPFASTRNPVDVTAQLVNEPRLYDVFVGDILGADLVDWLVVFLPHASREDGLTRAVVRAAEAGSEQTGLVVVGSMGADVEAWLRGLGVLPFATPAQAAAVLSSAVKQSAQPRPQVTAHRSGSGPLARRPTGLLTDEADAKALLAAWGVRTVEEFPVAGVDEAIAAAARLGFPVVLKRIDPGVSHKAAAGGVALGLGSPDAVRAAMADLMSASRSASRFVVQREVAGDELFVAVTNDSEWGTLALLGVGGVDVETSDAMSFRTAPPDRTAVRSMILETPELRFMVSTPSRSGVSDVVTELFQILSAVAKQPGIRTIELNPVIVTPRGECVAVDALIEWLPSGEGESRMRSGDG